MGLAISVGILASLDDAEGVRQYEQEFEKVNALLAKHALPRFNEPQQFSDGALARVAHTSSFPYSFVHYLRRAFAYTRANKPVTPMEDGCDPALDPVLDDEYSLHMDSHLCCHSDAEGFYLPLEMPVLYGDDHLHVAGGMVGSSIGLLRELRTVASAIGVVFDGEQLPDDVAVRVHDESAHEKTALWREQMVWLALWSNATVSARAKTAIVFN